MLSKVRIKDIQSLGQKKFRQAERRFIAEGPKVVEEFLNHQRSSIEEIFALPSWVQHHQDLTRGVPVTEVSETELEKISQLVTPHQVLAVIRQAEEASRTGFEGPLSLLLDGIQDPGNLGTIIRIADWFGIKQVFCSDDCADQYHPKVVQATMGSLARIRVSHGDINAWLNDHPGIPVFAAALEGKPIEELGKIKEGILLIGNESKGIRPALMERATQKITIPRKGQAESLNAAVATGIILSHIV